MATRDGTRRLPAVRAVLVVVVLLLGLVAGMAAPALAAEPTYVKYYVVTASYQGQPETLPRIAQRFLGTSARSDEIFSLNVNATQPDGGKLTNPDSLRAGWVLVLPWDAFGDGVKYGLPPMAKPVKPTATKPSSGTSGPPKAKPPATGPNSGCAGSSTSPVAGSQAHWAMLRLAPQRAWEHSRGAGVLVAVVDSGVDATVPELNGRITVGADIVTGTGRGDVDCVGSGTAMAGIVVGQSGSDATAVGMAPEANVMPVRVAPRNGSVPESDQATGIEVALSAGVKVIALGSYVDPALPAVAAAIEHAVARDVVVVVGAPTAAPVPAPPAGGGLLRVAAIGIDGAVSGRPQPGSVDVVAPGVDVDSVGITGTGRIQRTGTQYAVAFAAGQAALVRGMYPNLSAAQVVRRIQATADRIGSSEPDARYGWGLIDPWVAVTRVIADEGREPAPAVAVEAGGAWSAQRVWALVIMVAVALILVVLLSLRVRRMVRGVTPVPAIAPAGYGAAVGDSPGSDVDRAARLPFADNMAESVAARPAAMFGTFSDSAHTAGAAERDRSDGIEAGATGSRTRATDDWWRSDRPETPR